MMTKRAWQSNALVAFVEHRDPFFLLESTPGSGKTRWSAMCAKHLFDQHAADFALCVTPGVQIKGDKDSGFLSEWHKIGIEITTVLKEDRDPPSEFKGAVVTYQQLVNLVPTIKTWINNGIRLFSVFDELHHASEDNKWGYATESLGNAAVKTLGITGTAFRGDHRRISFVKYDNEGKAIPDFSYSYRDAVTDGVCRPVTFITDDSVAEFIRYQEQQEIRVSEANDDDEARNASRVIFSADSEWLEQVLMRADETLDQYRRWDADAGQLIVCRAGTDEADNRHLNAVAKLYDKLIGEAPVVVSYDDKNANALIEHFRGSHDRCICAVRKITEGVDIKRLRTLVMACRPTTELLFRQIVGRVVRVDDDRNPGDATVYIAKFPQLEQWARRIQEEAESGLQKRKEIENTREATDRESDDFIALSASHEAGGAISDFGESYTESEINSADRLRRENPRLERVSITDIAEILRSVGMRIDPQETPNQPLQIRKKRKRAQLAKLLRKLAMRSYPAGVTEDQKRSIHKSTTSSFFKKNSRAKTVDDLIDNFTIEEADKLIGIAESALAAGGML